MKRLAILVALVAALSVGVLMQPQQSGSNVFLCSIRNPPLKVVWSGGRLFAKVETRCERRVARLFAVACLQRAGSLDFSQAVTVFCRTGSGVFDNAVVATAAHLCDYTTYAYFWRVMGWARVSDPQLKVVFYDSIIVYSIPIIATCE